jgi:glycosyltransferase involved in cell wall biosynthesis
MKILVVQESDWIERGPHQSHHLMERLSVRGHEIRVIDYEIGWRQRKSKGLATKSKVFEKEHKVLPDASITVITPAIIKLPVIDYISLLYTHHQEIKHQLKEFKPDVIIGFGILNACMAIKLAKKQGIPFVYYIIDELHRLIPQKPLQWLGRKVESWNMRNSSLVISINEGLREYTIQMGAAREKTQVVRAGIDLDRFNLNVDGSEIRTQYGIKDNDIVLFFMGWLYEFSGLKEIALELGNHPDDYENIKLMIVGKGDLWNELQEIKNQYHLDGRLIMFNWQPYEDIPKYLAASDICVLPAYKNRIMENIVPIKLYEYMAMGKPVTATRLPGLVKEFGFEHGMRFTDMPQDVIKLAKNLTRQEIITDGLRASSFVKDNDWNRITNTFLESIKEITHNA